MEREPQPLTPEMQEMQEALQRGERPNGVDGVPLPYRVWVFPNSGVWLDGTLNRRHRIRAKIRKLRGGDRTIRLAPDYGVDVPLWPQSDETESKFPEELIQRLVVWQDFWESNHSWDRGWVSEESCAQWMHDGTILAADLRKALPPRWKLISDF